MRSLSTSAFGQPSETKLIFGVVPSAFASGSCMEEGLAAIEGKIKERLCEVLSVPRCLRFRVGLSFPCLLLVYALADEGGEHCQMKEEPVDQIGGKTQRFAEIDEQDHARVGRVVPGLVLIGVIENDNLTHPPAVNLIFDTNTEPFAGLGNDQSVGVRWQMRHVSGQRWMLL